MSYDDDLPPDPLKRAKEWARQLGPLLGAYHAGLIEAGFSSADALPLTRDFQRACLKRMGIVAKRPQPGSPPAP